MDQLFSEGGGAGAFGAFQPEAIEVSRRLVRQLREIGASIAVSPDERDAFEHRIIDPWLAEHPVRDLTFVRESPIARLAEQSRRAATCFSPSAPLRNSPSPFLSRRASIWPICRGRFEEKST